MSIEQTLSILKPDAVRKNIIGEVCSRIEKHGLRIVASRMTRLSKEEAAGFYQEHQGRPFFNDLLDYMSSGPIVVQVLDGENAISVNRSLMGATDPVQAAPGTIRSDFANSVAENAVHGSDSPESAKREISFFFSPDQIYGRF